MTVIDVSKDFQARTLTFSAEFSAPMKRVWQLFEDPRQLERWWGRRPGRRPSPNTNSLRAGE